MWNTVILPILTSLAATGLGILIVWLFNTKRRDDKIANEIARITNKIEAVEAKMDNGFNRETLEKDIPFKCVLTPQKQRWIKLTKRHF